MDTCVFCGAQAEKFDPEHWIPQWLSRELRKRGYVPAGDDDLFNMTVPRVCGDCNSVFLSNIESKCKPHVLPLILDDYTGVGPMTKPAIELIVRWCYLKVISLELGRPPEHQPTHDVSMYREFKRTRLPHPNSSLAIGVRERIVDRQPVYVTFASQLQNTMDGPTGLDLHLYVTTLVVGHLVVRLVGTPGRTRLNVNHPDGFQPVWPLIRDGGEFTWLPPKRLRVGIDGSVS